MTAKRSFSSAAWILGWASVVACSSTPHLHDAPAISGASGSATTGSSGVGGGATGSTGAASGAAVDAAAGGSDATGPGAAGTDDASGSAGTDATMEDGGDGAPEPDGTVDAGPVSTAPRCDPDASWSSRTPVGSIPAASFGRFGGVAGDELSLAWTLTTGSVLVADRAIFTDNFNAGATVDLGSTLLANDRVALAPNGMTLVAVALDRSTFVGFNRSGVGSAWNALPTAQFANLAGMVAESGGAFSEPVLGGDGLSFFFLLTIPGAPPALVESRWEPVNQQWGPGAGFADADLASVDATHRRRPTGASSDGLTLFFYDEVAGTERAAFRTGIGDSFVRFVTLLGLAEAAPTARCNALYYVDSSGGAPIVVAE